MNILEYLQSAFFPFAQCVGKIVGIRAQGPKVILSSRSPGSKKRYYTCDIKLCRDALWSFCRHNSHGCEVIHLGLGLQLRLWLDGNRSAGQVLLGNLVQDLLAAAYKEGE